MQEIFEISIWHEGAESRLVCRGKIDERTAPKLDEAVDLVLDRGPSTVYIDWTGVSVVTDAGIAVLLRAQTTCNERDIRLTVGASPITRRVLEIFGVEGMRHD